MDRTVLHCDCNGFFASVECARNPALRNVPMAVCGNPENRHGIILAKNELAKQYGIVTAETVWSALKKCPELTLVSSHHADYEAYSRRVNAIYARYTDMVEPFGIDESWLDVTGSRQLFGDGKQIADTLRRVVWEETGLTISVGVSFNKIFAKLGSDYKKPDATTVIDRAHFREMLFPLPVTDLLFVGKASGETLGRMGIRTIGELANADRGHLVAALGKMGEQLHDYANGLDDSPVRRIGEADPVKSVGNGMTFRRDLTTEEEIRAGAMALCDSVGMRMRRDGLQCTGVQVVIRDPGFHSISRQKMFASSTDSTRTLFEAAMELILANNRTPIRMLTVTAIGITEETVAEQMLLTDTAEDDRLKKRRSQIDRAMDSIRERYGKDAIGHLSGFDSDIGLRSVHKEDEPDEKR